MDNKIRKSLIDKSIDEFYYNPQIVVNENFKNIKTRIVENLRTSSKIDIAISYVVWSGLSLIYNDLKKFDKNSRILLTTEGFVTDPTSLKKLLELDIDVKVYNPNAKDTKGFHLKSYYFTKEEGKTILIGSNNISIRAFGLAHEMMVEIDSKNEGYIISEYERVFEELWSDAASVKLTPELIDNYSLLYEEKKRLEESFHDFKLSQQNIIPNYMQEKALFELNESRNHYNKGLVIAATGTGKTYLSAFDVRNQKSNKVLFLVHNRLILTDAMESYSKIFPNKKIMELKTNNISKFNDYDFVFTTDKTAYNHLYNKIEKDYFDYIIFDEAHRIGKDTLYFELINYFKPKYTLGITATPERTMDPEFLFQTFEYSVPYEIRLLDALNNELVCPFTYYGLDINDKLLDNNESFDYFALAKFIKKQIEEKSHYGTKLKALLFANSIKEANEINNYLNQLEFNSVVAVSGSKSQEEIEEDILSLKSNDENSVEIICTVNKFNEGIDIPDVNTIIMVRNTESSIIYLQQLGRGLRRTVDPDKFVTIYDLIGNSNNNYSIAQVLTANETADKRALYQHVANNFETVSPFINVNIEEKAIERIIDSISKNFTVKTNINKKFKDELARFEYIPTLIELYKNPYLKEMELLQLLNRSFYEAFELEYNKKYKMPVNNMFLRHFFRLITQFIFRGYGEEELEQYSKLLKGESVGDSKLQRILLPHEFRDGISSAINSNYNNARYNLPKAFVYDGNNITINKEVVEKLKKLNAYELYLEHIELIDYLKTKQSYQMEIFELVEKGEFLFNINSTDCYMNAVGERIDHENKVLYGTMRVSKDELHYNNYIIDEFHFVYQTQNSQTSKSAEEKMKQLLNKNYEFKICAQFPHLGYSNTSYFNLGDLQVVNVSDVVKNDERKYNHEITFKLSQPFPKEFLMYK